MTTRKHISNAKALASGAVLWREPQTILHPWLLPLGKWWPLSQGHLWRCPSSPALPMGLCPASSRQPPSLPACPSPLEGAPLSRPRVQSRESGHVGFVRQPLAARLLIYLPMHSLPSVFILLSAQDKWLPYSAELQRLQSSWVCRIYDKAENCLSASFMCARSRTRCCFFQMFPSSLPSPSQEVGWPASIPITRAWTTWVCSSSLASAVTQQGALLYRKEEDEGKRYEVADHHVLCPPTVVDWQLKYWMIVKTIVQCFISPWVFVW